MPSPRTQARTSRSSAPHAPDSRRRSAQVDDRRSSRRLRRLERRHNPKHLYWQLAVVLVVAVPVIVVTVLALR